MSLLVHLVPPSLSPVVPPHVPPCPLKLLYLLATSLLVSPHFPHHCPHRAFLPVPRYPSHLSHPVSPQSSPCPSPSPGVHPSVPPCPHGVPLVPTLSLPVPTASLPVCPVHPSMRGGAGRDRGGGHGGQAVLPAVRTTPLNSGQRWVRPQRRQRQQRWRHGAPCCL